jgi:Transposase
MSDRFDHKLEHKLETKPDEGDGPAVEFRRIELITGTGRRRKWSSDEKARIVFESLLPGANVSAVARRNGISPQHLFGWRREARALFDECVGVTGETVADRAARGPALRLRSGRPQAQGKIIDAPVFARAVIAAPVAPPPPPADPQPSDSGPSERPEPECPQGSSIEITVGEAVVRLSGHVDAAALAVVLDALRRTS